MDDPAIVTVDATNVDRYGFFCYKSKPKTAGYRHKWDWLAGRLAEGLRIKLIYEGGKPAGFVEYTPGEVTWRAMHAPNYLVIHCLWVVGRGKGKGYGSRLVGACLAEAEVMGKAGVAMVTSRYNWLASSKLLLKSGFEVVDQAPPSFELLVKKTGDAPSPFFPQDWEQRLGRFGPGLTILHSGQCPYLAGAVEEAAEAAHEMGLETQVVELKSCQEAQTLAPSAYGVSGVVYDGKLLTYYPVGRRGIVELITSLGR